MTLTAPTLLAPAMGGALDASAATFSWNAVPGATYRLQVSDSPGFATSILDIDAGPVTEITLSDALEPSPEARFWRVGAVDASGETAWSRPRPFTLPAPEALPDVLTEAEKARQAEAAAARREEKAARAFTVVPELPPAPVLPPLPTGATISGHPSSTDWLRVPGVRAQAPEAEVTSGETPRILGPIAGAIADGAAVTFRWTGVKGARSYEIEVGPDLSGPTLRMDGITTTELALNGVLPSVGDRLFWRVRAATASGVGPWSKYGRFYAGTDLQATAFHDRQESERAYARRVQEHESLLAQADLDLVAPCDRPIDPNERLGYTIVMAMMSVGILMIVAAAIGGMFMW